MNRSKPFLGETTDREKAFSGIASFELTVVQDRFGNYTLESWQRETRFTMANISPHLACANPRCQQGGLDLQRLVLYQPSGKHTISCNGHEGSPQGRRQGDPCDNSFEVELSVTREEDR
jgi:hypothetical protein